MASEDMVAEDMEEQLVSEVVEAEKDDKVVGENMGNSSQYYYR